MSILIIQEYMLVDLTQEFNFQAALTLGRTRKYIPPPWYKGEGGWWMPPPPPRVFNMLQYFETILPSVENL